MKSLRFEKGEICTAGDSTTAYKIKSGSMDVFLVPYKADRAGRRILIHEAKTGETVPGLGFTDHEHTRWVFNFRAEEDLELAEIEDGVTNVLKKKFAARAGLSRLEDEGFEYSAIEKYNEQKIREDLDISQKEEAIARAVAEKEQIIEQMTARKRLRKWKKKQAFEETKSGSKEAGNLVTSIGEVAAFSWARTQKADRLWIMLLSVAAAAAAAAMCFCAGAPFTCLAIAFLLLLCLKSSRINKAAAAAGADAQEKAFGALFELEEDAYRRYGKTELAALCINVYGMVNRIVRSAHNMASGALVCGVMFAGLIWNRTSTGLWFLLVSLVAGCLIAAGSVLAEKNSRLAGRSREKANTRLYHALRNINKIKVSGSEENILRDYYNIRAEHAGERLQAIHMAGAAEAIQILVIIAAIPVSALTVHLPALVLPLAVLAGCWIQVVRTASEMPGLSSDLGRVGIILEERGEEMKAPVEAIDSLEVEDVWFSYGEQEVLRGMDLSIRRGETVGLIGASGSGKTTLLKLLTGIERPARGTIRVNGTDMDEIDLRSFRKKVGIVSQEEMLISASLIDNIRMGSGASAEEVFDCLVKAGMAEFVGKLPMGVDTLLSEEGGNISFGQKQKIFIARALVRKPDLLILDEAMSEMDNASIEDICLALRELDAAIIIVSHRMEPLKYCDKIVVTE